MTRILHPEFRDRQDDSYYPFGDTASLATTDGNKIFSDTFIDAAIYPIGGGHDTALTKIVVGTGREATIYIGTAQEPELASGTVDFLAPGTTVVLSDKYSRPAGMLLSDATRLSIFQSWSAGTYQFINAPFAASVITPMPAVGVRGFITKDGDHIELSYGDTWLVGENGAVVRKDGNTIRVDFIGDPLFRRRLCLEDALFDTPNFLRTINGYEPDDHGNFNLTVGEHAALDTVLRITPNEAGLKITAAGQPLETTRITRD
tara:strand:+ start:6216 stop:6995 length:780 start_codon:yes stop_codon:yes gene_type:complete